MNAFEIVGIVVVYGLAGAVGGYTLYYLICYLAVVYAQVVPLVIWQVGVKDSYKQNALWRVRLFFHLLFSFRRNLDMMTCNSISSPYFYINFEGFWPKVTVYRDEE